MTSQSQSVAINRGEQPTADALGLELPSGREERKQLAGWKRALLLIGLLWALLVVAPDVYRVFGSLAAFGFSANNSGSVYAVSESAVAEGLQEGDRILLRPGA